MSRDKDQSHPPIGKEDTSAVTPHTLQTLDTDALRRDKPLTVALLFACVSALTALACWTLSLLPAGDIRGNPLFLLLALLFGLWFHPLSQYRLTALRYLRLALVIWPLIGISALLMTLTIPDQLSDQSMAVAYPLAPWISSTFSVLAAIISFLALRRSSIASSANPTDSSGCLPYL